MKKGFYVLGLSVALAGCGNADRDQAQSLKTQVSQLQAEVANLKTQLDEEKNGAARLMANAKASLAANNSDAASKTFNDLIARHPGTAEAVESRALLASIEAKRLAEAQAKKAEADKKAESDRLAAAQAEKNLSKNVDEVRGITWISHRSEPITKDYMSLYFGTDKGSAASYPLRLKFHYFADDWLFVESVTVKADDETFNLGEIDFKRDNAAGSVWEWSDEPLRNRAMVDKVVASKKTIIRFNGRQYYHDFVLPESQKTAMKEIISAWQGRGGKA